MMGKQVVNPFFSIDFVRDYQYIFIQLKTQFCIKRAVKVTLSLLTLFSALFFTLLAAPFQTQETHLHDSESLSQLFLLEMNRGEDYLRSGNFQESAIAFEKGLKIAEQLEDMTKQANCLLKLGLLYWNSGNLEESSKFYKQALMRAQTHTLPEARREAESALEIYKLYSEGKKYRSQSLYEKSIASFEKAIALARKMQSTEHELKCLRQESITKWEANDFEGFCSLNEEALEIARNLNHKKEIGRCLMNIGLYYSKTNEYSKALSYYQEALTIARELNNEEDESACLNNLGVVYLRLGFIDKSIFYLMNALEIDRNLGNDAHISMDLINAGEMYRNRAFVYRNKEDFKKALNYFLEGFSIAKKTDNNKTEIQALNNIASVYLDLSKYDKALLYLQSALSITNKVQYTEAKGMILNNLGFVYLNLEEINKAESYFLKAIELGQSIYGGEILWEAYFGLAQCYEKEGETARALTAYKKSLEVIDLIREHIALDIGKSGFARTKLKVYEGMINLLYALYTKESSETFGREIFHVIEKAKARAFLESLGESRVDLLKRFSSSLKKEGEIISDRISLLQQELLKNDLSLKQRKKLLEELQSAEEASMIFMSKIRLEIPEVANMVSPEPCHIEQVQELLLDRRTALVEYFLLQDRSYMIVLTKNHFALFTLPPRDEIKESIRAYLKMISDPPEDRFKGVPAAKRLYNELIGQAVGIFPQEIKKLVIIPDGILYYLPFETLVCERQNSSGPKDYLIKKYEISYAPSSSSLLFLSEKKERDKMPPSLLAFGDPVYDPKHFENRGKRKKPSEILKELYLNEGFDFSPLPHSKEEVQKIAKFFPKGNRDVYLKEQADEETIKNSSLQDYKIIHFACHGFLDEDFPFRSALVLSLEDGKEDGFLQVREIYNLRLTADLVVLSACQTGKGKMERGEGILGLPRIFFYSGARSVLSTLWKIEDKSTSLFMQHFYRFLFQGKDKAEALRLAKLKMLESRYSHPFYWAAFVLNGECLSAPVFN